MDMNTIEDTNAEVENSINEPIYKSKDGQIITHSQLLSSGYKVNDINAGVTDKTLSLIGDTKDEDQEFQSKDGQKVNTKTLLSSGYSQKDIDGGILDGILTPIEKKNQVQPSEPDIPIVDISQVDSSGSQDGASNVITPTPTETQAPIDASGRIIFDQKEPSQPKVAAPNEPAPANSIDLILQANDNLNKKVGKIKDQAGREREIDQPDLKAQDEGKKTLDYLKTFKIDTDDLYNKIKDLPPEIYNATLAKQDGTIDYPYSKEKLFEMYQNEPAKFTFTVNHLKNMADIIKGAKGATIDGQPVDKSYFGKLYNNLNQSTTHKGWLNNKEQQIELINKYLPSLDSRRVALDRLETNASMYYTPANPNVIADYNASPLKDKLDPAQFAALQMQKMFNPKAYQQAIGFLDVKPQTETAVTLGVSFTPDGFVLNQPKDTETQESINLKVGKETTLKNLADAGRYNTIMNLQYKNEKIASQLKQFPTDQYSELVNKYNTSADELKKISAQNEELKNNIEENLGKYKTPYIQQYNANIQKANSISQEMNSISEQFKQMPQDNRGQLIGQFNDNLAKINAVKDDYKKDADKYPNYFNLKYEQQVKDFMQQTGFNAVQYGIMKFGMGLIKTGRSIENVSISLFGNNEDKIIHDLASYGESQVEAQDEYLPSKYQSGNNLVSIKVSDDLKSKLDAVIRGRDLSDLNIGDKDFLKNILSQNQDQVHTITDTDKNGKGANFWSYSTLYANTGMLGDIMSFVVQAGVLTALGVPELAASAIPLWTTTQDDFRKEGIAKGLTGSELDGYANLNATIMFLAGMVTPKLVVLKKLAGIGSAESKMLAGITEDTWNTVVNKNRPIIDRIKNSVLATTKEAAKMTGTFGIAAPALQQIVGKEMYGDRVSYGDIKNNVMESAEHLLKSSAALLAVGAITNFKSTSPEQKAALWQLGANPKIRLAEIEDALKNGEINSTQADARKKVIQDASNIIQTMPTKNMQGKPLTDKQRVDYFYNLLIQDKAKTEKKSLPIQQVKKIEYAEMVADHLNNLIVDPQDETKLNGRIKELNKILKDNVDDIDAKSELDAINIHLENLAQEKEPTKTAEEILTGKPVPIKTLEEIISEETIPDLTVGDLLDKTGKYKGQDGLFYLDGQTVIFKVEGQNKEYELGNINEIKDSSIKDFGIEHKESVVTIGDNGELIVRGEEYKNRYSDPLMAIDRDANGNVIGVTLETKNGNKRRFRGNTAEDIAYQIHLQEITKNNETRQFEEFINEPEQQQQIDIGAVPESTTEGTVTTNEPIQREKIEPIQQSEQDLSEVKIQEPSELDKAKEARLAAKEKLNQIRGRLGVIRDTKAEAQALYDYHVATIKLAKEHIKEGIKTLEEFAKSIGEKVTEQLKTAWNDAQKNIQTIKSASESLKYNTGEKEGISYLSESSDVDYPSGGGVQGEGGKVSQSIVGVWGKDKNIQFTGTTRVKNAADVAHIMQLLENKTVEHAFAVHIDKNGKSHIQFLSIGGLSGTVVDPKSVLAGAKKFKSVRTFLIHNHPSGNMQPSNADLNITAKIRAGLEPLGIKIEHVIMDTFSKEYIHIDELNEPRVYKRDENLQDNVKLSTYSMNDMMILSKPIVKVRQASDAVNFLQQLRFTAMPKNAMLLLDYGNSIIGNYVFKGEIDYEQITSFVAESGIGSNVIFYGNNFDKALISAMRDKLVGLDIKVLDHIVTSSDTTSVNQYYESMMEAGHLSETQLKYGTNIVNEVGERDQYKKNATEALKDVIYIKDYKDGAALAHGVKNGDPKAIKQMAEEMASRIPKDATIIPMAGRNGIAGNMLLVANEISKINGNKVADIITGEKRESLYDLKKQGRDISQMNLGLKLKGKVPKGEIYVIDNVVATGKTATEIKKLLPDSKILVHSLDTKVLNETLGVSETPTTSVEVTSENINKLDAKKKNELAEKAGIFYHGTVANFKEFIANKIKSGAIQIKGALFFTNKKARADAFGLQSYKNVSSELFQLSRGIINLNDYESYKNSTRELPKDLMNNVNNYFKSIGIEATVKTIGDLAKAYEKYRNEKEAKYNVKAIKIKESAKIKVIEGKKNWKDTLSKLNIETGQLKNEYKNYDVLIFKNIEDYPLMQNPSEEITNADNIVVLNPSKIETIENESDAISNLYNETLRIPKEKRSEQQNELISSVNETLGVSELPQQKGIAPITEPKTAAEKKTVADQLRQLKSGKGKAYDAVLGVPVAIWDGAVELIAKAIEGSTEVAEAIRRGINYIEKNHRGKWDKQNFNQKVIESLGFRGIRVNGEDVIVKSMVDKQSAEVINGFYSPLEQGILNAKAESLTGKEWADKLQASTDADELKFTGMSDFLSDNANKSLTKQEVLDYMKNNRIEINEIQLGEGERSEWIKKEDGYYNLGDKSPADKKYRIVDEGTEYNEFSIYRGKSHIKTVEGLEEAKEEAEYIALQSQGLEFISKNTKYSDFQLSGESSNYKEILITLPITKLPKGYKVIPKSEYIHGSTEGRSNFLIVDDEGYSIMGGNTKEEAISDFLSLRKESGGFTSPHFDEPNILAHIRLNTRVDADGNKVVHIEEFQSDWGKEGREYGFLTEKDRTEGWKIEEATDRSGYYIFNPKGKKVAFEFNKEDAELELNELANISNQTGEPMGSTSPAPFVTETGNWVKLSWKVALKEAVKEGADKITWTTGEQQNDRYRLDKDVESILHKPNSDGTYQVEVFGHNGGTLYLNEKATLKDIESTLGKEIAEKIEKNEGETEKRGKILEGEDLTISGKGMKGFYGSPSEGKLGIVGDVIKSMIGQEPKTTILNKGVTENLKAYEFDGTQDISDVPGSNFINKGEWVVESPTGLKMIVEASSRETAIQEFKDAASDADVNIPSGNESVQHSIEITPEIKEGVKEGMGLFKAPFERTELQKAQEARRAAKAKLDEIKGRLGIAKDIEAQAQALFDYHKALVAEAKEYVKLGIKKVEEFAKEIGEKVDDAVKAAWNEAMGINPPAKVPEDLKHIARMLETDEEWTGISQARLKEIEEVRELFEREKGTNWPTIQREALEQLARKYPDETIYDAARLEVEILANKYDNKEDYNPTTKDLAVIQEFKRQTEQKIDKLKNNLNSEKDVIRNLAVLKIEAYQDDLVKVGKASFKREAGTAFGFRASESRMDENYGLQIRKAQLIRANDGEELSKEDNDFLNDQWAKEKELMKKEQQIREQGLKDAFDVQLDKVKKDYEEKMKLMKAKTTPEVRKQALSKTGKDVANVIRRLKLRGTKLDFTIGGWNLAVEGVAKIVEAGFTVAEAIEQLIQNKTIGFKTAEDRKIFEDNLASFINNLDRRETSLEDIKKMAQANGDTTVTIDMVKKGLIKDFINSHVGEFENKDILEEAYNELKKILPDLDRNALRRAMLRLDEFKTPDKKTIENMLAQETRALQRLLEKEENKKVQGNEQQKRLLEKEKKSIQRKIREFQRKLKEGEFEKEEPVTLKKQDAELIQLNKEKKEAEGAFRKKQQELEEKNKHWLQRFGDTVRNTWVAFLIGSPVTLAKVGYMSLVRPSSEIIRKAVFGKLFNLIYPNISKAAERGGESSGLRPIAEGLKAYFRQNTAASIEKKSQLAIQKYDQSAKAYYDALNTGADTKTLKKLEKQMNRDLENSLSNIIYQFIGGSSLKDSWQSFINRSNEIEKQFGKVDIESIRDGNALDKMNYIMGFIGRSHSAAKTFSGRFSFAVSFMSRLEGAIKDGSISDPNKIIEIAHESYLDWERGKYQQDNWLTEKWNEITAAIRKNTSKNPKWKPFDKGLEFLTKSEVAITRVPVNVLWEQVGEYARGAFVAPIKAYREIKSAKAQAKMEGYDKAVNSAEFKKRVNEIVSTMDQDQAARIFRLFTKGGLGLGLYGLTLVTGLMHFGVFPHKGQKQKKEEYELEPEELNPGQVMFGDDKLGETASKLVEHTPALWPSFMGLGLAKIYADDVKAGKMTSQAAWDAVYTHLQIVEGAIPQTKVFSPLNVIKGVGKTWAGKASSYGMFDSLIDAKGNFIDKEKEGLKLTSPEVLRLEKYGVAPLELGTRKQYKIEIDKTHPKEGLTPKGKEYALMNPHEFTKFTEYRKSYINETLRELYRAEDGAYIGVDKDFNPDYTYLKPNRTIYNLMRNLANKPVDGATIELNKQVLAEIMPIIISQSSIVAKNKLIEEGLLPESNYEDEEGNENIMTIKEIIQDLYENNTP